MLKINNIKKNYKDFKLNCSLEVNEGSITALLGQNGAGKSTTFKAILNIIDVDEGNIKLFNKDIKEFNYEDKNNIGFVLSDSFFSSYLNIKDIRIILKNMYINFDEILFDNLITKMNLPTNKAIKEFSSGMKAKIKIICAITHKAKFLLLDEPTAGLDVIARDEVLNLIRDYVSENEGVSVLISSHISSDIESLCDDFYLIENGEIITHDTIDNIMNEYAIIKISDEVYKDIDKNHIISINKELYGYKLLVKERQYYIDNYKNIVIEKANMDEVIKLLSRREK